MPRYIQILGQNNIDDIYIPPMPKYIIPLKKFVFLQTFCYNTVISRLVVEIRIQEIANAGKIIRPAYKSVAGRNEYIKLEQR